MKHIRQSSQQHASGAFDIAKDRACLPPVLYSGAISFFPVSDETEEAVPICGSVKVDHLEEYPPQLASVRSLGGITAPRQPLALDMDETALHGNTWPELSDDSGHVGVAVNREATGAQTVTE